MEKISPTRVFLECSGNMGRQIGDRDWSEHPLGPIDAWSPYLRIALNIILNSRFPAYLMWGPQFHVLYNDAYIPILGDKVRMGQGIALGELWSEISEAACSIAERAFAGESSTFDDQLFVLERHGAPERAFFTFSFSPVRDDVGRAVGVLCTIVETTDKVMAHAKLMESEERLQISLDASGNIGTWSYDPETNETIVDERFSALFQVDAALAQEGTELERFTNMIHPDDRERVLAAIGHAIQSGDVYHIEYRIPQLSGKIVWVNVKGRMFGRRFAGVAVDITERKAADEKLRQLAADLSETSQRKTEFLATLAHELRNPLAPLRTGLELMSMSTDPAVLRRVQTMMQRQVDQLVHLVEDLMDVARINSGKVELKLELVDIKGAITAAIETIMPHVQKARHALLTDLPDESLLVSADATRLTQVLGNILTNAVKYTQSEGRIVVGARRIADQIVISVSDNGIGIPNAALPTVFEMFNQVGRETTHSRGGLGVGLALVRQLVELHGGTVVATSAGVDKGSTFRIALPAASDQNVACAPIEMVASALDVPSRNLKILIADDNLDACATLSALLEFGGHQVLTAADGDQAILLAQSFLPELIFLDIGMPGKNGHEVAKTIRTLPKLRDSTLVALTGWGTDQDRVLSREAGFDQHLTKPVSLADISRVLRAVSTNGNSDEI